MCKNENDAGQFITIYIRINDGGHFMKHNYFLINNNIQINNASVDVNYY